MNTPRSTAVRRGWCAVMALALPAGLALAAPPQINYTTALQSKTVYGGKTNIFRVSATGTGPFSYQWKFNGIDLEGETNTTLTLRQLGAKHEGDYTVGVTNAEGGAVSQPATLWVVPETAQFTKANFTNANELRLPYFHVLPDNYDPARKYPLFCNFHGSPMDESLFVSYWSSYPAFFVLSLSYRQQQTDPAISVFPTRRSGDNSWTPQYLQQVSEWLDHLVATLNIDTNRIYVGGGSEGMHAAWDMLGLKPGFFAAAQLAAGWAGSTRASLIKDVPTWAECAQNDTAGQLGNTQQAVRQLRLAGGNPIYTEYQRGGHVEAGMVFFSTPAYVHWLLSQRRGVPSTLEPLLAITTPADPGPYTTSAPTLSLAGSAAALGEEFTQIAWENTTIRPVRKGTASGTDPWTIDSIPLAADRTNVIVVTATTTSWDAANGGNTTFNDAVSVHYVPIRLVLAWDGGNWNLNWTGGEPPYELQRATDLTLGDWSTLQADATTPLKIDPVGANSFYRVIGR